MNMPAIIVASNNPHKVEELRQLLGDGPWTLTAFSECPGVTVPPETGLTFAANAVLKAEAVATQTGAWTLADDSGLVVDILGGMPGVISARYAGPEHDDARNNARLLADLMNVSPDSRAARFVCVLALARPGHPTRCVQGTCEGVIASEPRGTNGFGYDPLFFCPDLGRTMAELTPSEKNRLSHRAHAARHMRKILLELIDAHT